MTSLGNPGKALWRQSNQLSATLVVWNVKNVYNLASLEDVYEDHDYCLLPKQPILNI